MRILFITAFYPPYVVGGWEQLVQDINVRLQARGHVTRVLTSTYGLNTSTYADGADRLLTLESDLYHYNPLRFLGYKRYLQKNLGYVKETIEAFEPDVVFVHGMWNLSRGVAWVAEQCCPSRVVYYVANNWPYAPDPHTAYWRDPARNLIAKIAKELLAPIPLKIIERENRAFALKFQRVLCVSQALKNDLAHNANIAHEQMRVVYNGVETDLFVPPSRFNGNGADRGLSLLYAGSLVPHKGVHTAIEAMAILARKSNLSIPTLSIVGSGHVDYEAHLRQLVREANLAEQVHFLGRVAREEMPALLQRFDVLVFPSIWEEPLARMTQEAMAAGLVVVGTVTGGTGELLVENETGLTFEPEDAEGLARRIEQLSSSPELRIRLAKNARDRVVSQFDIRRMIDEIEAYLMDTLQEASQAMPERISG